MQLLLSRFRSAFENLNQLLISSRNLDFFTSGYRYLIQILPAAVVAPMYFSGKIEFGVINQSVSAFNHILGDFSLIVYQFQALSAFSAVIDRLGEFDDVLDSNSKKGDQDSKEKIQLNFCLISSSNGLHSNGSMPLSKRVKLLHVEHLTVQTPSEATLIKDLSFEIFEKDHLLVTGPSGSGKTSLLRVIAGLWSFGNGAITVYVRPRGDLEMLHSPDVVSYQVTSTNETIGDSTGRRKFEGVIFLPQKPYMVLGTLRQQLLYPTWTEDSDNLSDDAKQSDSVPFLMRARDARCVNERSKKPTSEDLLQVLNDVSLGHLLSRFDGLDSTHEWSSVLSLGEQQRLAFGRLLLSKPTLALLDESTSALDEANEARLYQLIQAAGITYISIGHRRTLYKYHKKVLHVSTADSTSTQQNWSFKDVEEDPIYDFSKQ
uniref:Putative ovule protein n=1 Tax=Solanum chacoense TaxID=4108 RepID=A0A0V0INQ5_SOLCH